MVSAGAVVFLLLGTGSVFAGVAWASRDTDEPVSTPSPSITTPDPRPVSTLPATASRLRTCSIAGAAADGRLATLYGTVIRADTGEVLFDRNGSTPAPPASVLKVLTAAAAISVLGPDFRITTSVYEGSSPGTIVLVGRGDTTLSRLPVGQESVYAGAPKLQTLAEGVIAQYSARHPDVPITNVVLDSSYWSSGDAWEPTWREDQRTEGYQAPATALQVDGDRDNPRAAVSPRSTDPVGRAGNAFLDALRAADTSGTVVDPAVATSLGTAVGTDVLAEVQSQPLRTLLPQMLLPSDNMLGEMLARITSKQSGGNGSAASLQGTITSQLTRWGVPATGIVIKDGSGLSPQNAVPTNALTILLRSVRDGVDGLDAVRDGLPVAGKSGTISSRFTGDNAVARGNVFAKSGMIRGSYTLAGIINSADGTPLVFSFFAARDGVESGARAALDTLTTAAFRCGDNLSNN
ncbi:D-alanyl-D-alanine carboxypeptidase [Protaetiibacter intestinalis]|uniref:D-alanyl-D-alanine carboxypeptidase n=1 Tax=Protaetiibacter intestinalis TaxID=2419774 RepID=A0A387BF33_9MICO|nr:D-alanyl-D-alanine carboxypeptidase [Protaetiibacter intestinalis]